MLIKKQFAITLIVSTLALGLFQIINDDYLAKFGFNGITRNFQWVDDNVTGFVFVCFSIFLLFAFLSENLLLQKIGVVILGAMYFSLGTVYMIRSINGYNNITWILLYTLFFLLIFSIRYKGDQINYEGINHQ